MKYYTNKARQAGMTLIELTVVLLVLIGLAGLLMPYVSGFVEKTHDGTGTNNLAEVNSAILKYDAAYQNAPDDMDSLVDQSAGVTDVYSKLMGPNCFEMATLAANQVTALKMGGIGSVMGMDDSTADATFAATTTSFPIAVDVKLARLTHLMECTSSSPTMAINNTNLKSVISNIAPNVDNMDYFVFGIGSENSLIGETVNTSPVHFAKSGAMGPTSKYNRFAVVYEVPKEAVLAAGGYCLGHITENTTIATDPQPGTKGLCVPSTLATGTVPGTDDEVAGTWTSTSSATAKYVGPVMLMGMVEGLTGALKAHYSKSANH